MPFYSVNVTAQVSMLVEADSEDDASDFAYSNADFENAGVRETSPAELLDTDEKIQPAKRHADQECKAPD